MHPAGALRQLGDFALRALCAPALVRLRLREAAILGTPQGFCANLATLRCKRFAHLLWRDFGYGRPLYWAPRRGFAPTWRLCAVSACAPALARLRLLAA